MCAPRRVVFVRVFEEVDDLAQLLLGLVDTGDIVERHIHVRFGDQFRLAAAGRSSPPPRPPPIIPRAASHQTPKKISGGTIHDSSEPSALLEGTPLNRTPRRDNSAARSGATRLVRNEVAPLGSFSDAHP